MPSRFCFRPLPIALALLCALLAACETQPVSRPDAIAVSESPLQQAQATLIRAEGATSPQRDRLLVQAAAQFAAAGRPEEAEQALRGVDTAVLDIPELAAHTLTYGRIALDSERYLLARGLLGNERLLAATGEMGIDQRRDWHRLRGELQARLGNDLASAAEYASLATLLDSPRAIQRAHDSVWQGLAQAAEGDLRAAALATTDPVFAGWLSLAQEWGSGRGDIAWQLDRVEAWRRANAGHPAAITPPTSLREAAAARGDLPARIAILLPLDGELAAAARPLQEGILAAYFAAMESGASPPALRLYDTTHGDINAHYDQAVAEGAELVIGPLSKDKLQQLMERPQLSAPVLGLNFIDDAPNPHGNLYQFGLGVGDEARQLAERAWVEGRRSALVVRLDSGWSSTAVESFGEQWREKGGLMLTTPPFPAGQPDYAAVLRDALLLRDSDERATRLQRTLGKRVATVPRRRMDVDMVLLLTQPEQGRQIKPTLEFLFAGDLPIYASSHIHAGVPNPSRDRDLDGIQFTALPWSLPGLADQHLAPATPLPPAFHNLFAMGVDAYRLHQWLGLLKALPDTRLQGQTGALGLADGNRVIRTLAMAVFRDGRAVPAPAATDGPQ